MVRGYLANSGGGADKQADRDDTGCPDEAKSNGEAIEISFSDRRTANRGRDAAAEQVRQSPTLATVQQDEDDEQGARDDKDHGEDDGEDLNHWVRIRVWSAGEFCRVHSETGDPDELVRI